jgi:hypothetical protein
MRVAFLVALLIVFAVHSGVCAASYITYDEVSMALKGSSASLQVNYTLDSIASLYVLALGCRNIEPHFSKQFPSFSSIKTVKADMHHALLLVEDAGKLADGFYVFESKPLRAKVSKFTVIYPGGESEAFYNVTETPRTSITADLHDYIP